MSLSQDMGGDGNTHTLISCNFTPGRIALEGAAISATCKRLLDYIEQFQEAEINLQNLISYDRHLSAGGASDERPWLQRLRSDIGVQCESLAASLLKAHHLTDDDRLLTEAVDLARESLFHCPEGHRHRARSCGTLVSSLMKYYDRTGDDDCLLEVIDLQRAAHALWPPGHPDRAYLCGSLADSLLQYYDTTGQDKWLLETVDLCRRALLLWPPAHSYRLHLCWKLANSLVRYHESTGNVKWLLEAIDVLRECLSLCPPGYHDLYRAHYGETLASALLTYYDIHGDEGFLREAIAIERESDSLCAGQLGNSGQVGNFCKCRIHFCSHLANTLWRQFQCVGDVGILLELIGLYREALSLKPSRLGRRCPCAVFDSAIPNQRGFPLAGNLRPIVNRYPRTDPNRPQTYSRSAACVGLAEALYEYYEIRGDVSFLLEAIQLLRESLSLRPPKDLNQRISCYNNLLSLVNRCHASTGDCHLQLTAMQLGRECLSICPPRSRHRSQLCANFASSLLALYKDTEDKSILLEMIDLGRESRSLADHLTGFQTRAHTCVILASALRKLHESTGDDDLILEALDLQQESLSLYPVGHRNIASSSRALAELLQERYRKTSDPALLNCIHQLCHTDISVEYSSTMWKYISITSWLRLQAGTLFFNPDMAIQDLRRILINHPHHVREVTSLTMAALDHFWQVSRSLQLDHRVDLVSIYGELNPMLALLISPVNETREQLQILSSASKIGCDAFVNAGLAGDWKMGLEELELVQGLLWSQRFHYRDPQVQDVPAMLADKLKGCLTTLRSPSAITEHVGTDMVILDAIDIRHNQTALLSAILREIRELPGLDRFMLGETCETLFTVASTHPVVVLVEARQHYYALMLCPDVSKNCLISLNLTEDDVTIDRDIQHVSRSCRGAYKAPNHLNRAVKIVRPDSAKLITHQLRRLWLQIVGPVLEHLGVYLNRGGDRPRLYWCPTGRLTRMPLHAAGIYDGPLGLRTCCANYVVSSYTPTLTTLLRAQRSFHSVIRDQVNIAIVAEKYAKDPHLDVIHQVDVVLSNMVAVARANGIERVYPVSNPVTVSHTATIMQDANIVHLACHGIQDSTNATQSGFYLTDGRLTISNMMELQLNNAFLAFLSACETAKGDMNQPDQVMHLAAAMLFIGFKTVIATMWAISDEDGPKVAKWFYERLFASEVIDADAVAYALDAAVAKLREEGVPLERWAPFIHMGA